MCGRKARRCAPAPLVLAAVLEQQVVAAGAQYLLDRAREHAEQARQFDLDVDVGIADVEPSGDVLAHGTDVEVKRVAFPTLLNFSHPARQMLAERADISGDPGSGFVLAELVCKVHFNRSLHEVNDGGPKTGFQWWEGKAPAMTLLAVLMSLALQEVPAAPQDAAPATTDMQDLGNPVIRIPTEPKPGLVYTPIDTADEYVAEEQGATAFARWLDQDQVARGRFAAFQAYLVSEGVGSVLPLWQLTRTASAWRSCNAPPLEVPPDYMWPGLAQTLRYVRDEVVPVTGEVEAVSVYRNPLLNSCAGGSARSAHRSGLAIDMVPRWPFDRRELMRRLCHAHAEGGQEHDAGFGFYVGLRFHVDTAGYRSWGVDPGAGASCARALTLREAARNSTDGGE